MSRIGRKSVGQIILGKITTQNELKWVEPKLPKSQGKPNLKAQKEHPLDPNLVALAFQILRGCHGKTK